MTTVRKIWERANSILREVSPKGRSIRITELKRISVPGVPGGRWQADWSVTPSSDEFQGVTDADQKIMRDAVRRATTEELSRRMTQ